MDLGKVIGREGEGEGRERGRGRGRVLLNMMDFAEPCCGLTMDIFLGYLGISW